MLGRAIQTIQTTTFTQPETDLFEYEWLVTIKYIQAVLGRYDGPPELCYPYEPPEVIDVHFQLVNVVDLRNWPFIAETSINYYHLVSAPIPDESQILEH